MNALRLELIDMTKQFGSLTALRKVSLKVRPGSVHALLGENGAGKSTLVKCLVGFYQPDDGAILIDGREQIISSPKDAGALGIGMVYQHFTLVPSMTVAENLVASAARLPKLIAWGRARKHLAAFLKTMPLDVPLDALVSQLSAGEKQKVELIKQLYLGRRLLILDEPTSVLTPDEAQQVLGLVRQLTHEGKLSAILITHKFGEVTQYADDVTILRHGVAVRSAPVAELSVADMAEAMVGRAQENTTVERKRAPATTEVALSIRDMTVLGDVGLPAVKQLNVAVRGAEIVGVAGVSGNGQKELVEALMGQRAAKGEVTVAGQRFHGRRSEIARLGVYGLPQEPQKYAFVPRMSLAENLALRNFDQPPLRWGFLLNRKALSGQAADLVRKFRVKTSSLGARMSTLSGGNAQRAVLARELTNDVRVLIASNPTFGLDFKACDETHERILAARNAGAAVLLISEDLDELLGLADRIVVMSGGRLTYEVEREKADRRVLGSYMAGAAATN